MRRISRAVIAGAATMAAAALLPAVAAATPPSGVTGVILFRTTIGDTDYVLREITIAPGGTTGWHYHRGPLYALIRSGNLDHYDSACHPDLTGGAGSLIVEHPGADHVHIERNSTPDPQVLDVLYVLPAGSALSQDAPAPACRLP